MEKSSWGGWGGGLSFAPHCVTAGSLAPHGVPALEALDLVDGGLPGLVPMPRNVPQPRGLRPVTCDL